MNLCLRRSLQLSLVLLLLIGGNSEACLRRLEDFIPGGQPRSPFEEALWSVAKRLETCYEKYPQPSAEVLPKQVEAVLEGWKALEEKFPGPSEETPVDPEEYRLILESIWGSLLQLQQAQSEDNRQEAARQAIGIQHMLGEFYGQNPGAISPINLIAYTIQSLDLVTPSKPGGLRLWESRLGVIELRMKQWIASASVDLERLASVRGFWREFARHRNMLAEVQVLLSKKEEIPQNFSDRWKTNQKEILTFTYQAGIQLRRVSFSSGAYARFLEPDDPEFNPRAR